MKTLLGLLISALATLLIGGCTVPSLNPLATPETTITDQDLVGRWGDGENDDTTYVVSQAGDTAYQLKCIPKEAGKRPLEFEMTLVKLTDSRFIDLTVTKTGVDELNDRYGTVAIPAHIFMKVKRKGDELTVWMIKNDWLIDGLKSGELKLTHAAIIRAANDDKQDYVLTGATTELQNFVRKNAENEAAWDKPNVMRRLSDDQPLVKPAKSEPKK